MNRWQRFRFRLADLISNVRAAANILSTWEEGTPLYPEVQYEAMVKEGYRKNELIFSCIGKTASTASQVNLNVLSPANEVLPNHPLKALIDQPNPFMSQYDFWYSVIIFQKLSGWAAYEKERNALGEIVALWPLRPDWLEEIRSSTKVVAGYRYGPDATDKKPIRAEDVLVFRVFDPLGFFHHFPPVAVASRVGTVDNSATDYLQLFFQHGGTPPGIIKTKIRLKDAMVTDLRRRWGDRYGGVAGWLQPAILDQDAEYQKIGLDFREMGFETLDSRNEARICMVLDVPPIMISTNIGLLRSTFSNYREARLAWWQDSLLPHYANLRDALVSGLQNEFEGISLEWDFSRVPALQEERSARWERAGNAFAIGAITLNEFSNEVGLPDKGPAGEVYVRPLSHQEVPNRAPKKPSISNPTKVLLPAGVKITRPPDWDTRQEVEQNLNGKIEEFLRLQRDRVEEQVEEFVDAGGV